MRAETPASEAMRFPIRRSPWWVPLLLLFGATPGRSYVELADDRLVARFGWLFHHSFPLADIEGAGRRSWPLLYGIGWRSNLFGVIGLIGVARERGGGASQAEAVGMDVAATVLQPSGRLAGGPRGVPGGAGEGRRAG